MPEGVTQSRFLVTTAITELHGGRSLLKIPSKSLNYQFRAATNAPPMFTADNQLQELQNYQFKVS
jgi:hypothetical protein